MQFLHGFLIIKPLPKHLAHVLSSEKNPCCVLVTPDPWHIGQVSGFELPSDPLPEHLSHLSYLFNVISIFLPLNASSKVNSRLYLKSLPRVPCWRAPALCPLLPPEKKSSKISENEPPPNPKSANGLPCAPAPPPKPPLCVYAS